MKATTAKFKKLSGKAFSENTELRDYLAGQALQGLLTDPEMRDFEPKQFAELSYEYADEMLKAR